MRGHSELIAMRRGGMRPSTVSIHAGTDHSGACVDWHTTIPTHAHVEINDGEPIAGLDLRFTVGMLVFVTGDDAARVTAIHAGCLEAGADRVVSAIGATGAVSDSKLEVAQ